MRTKSRAFVLIGLALLVSMILLQSSASAGAARRGESAESPEWLQAMVEDMIAVRPLVSKLLEMRELIEEASATSPSLEKIDKLVIKADMVDRLHAGLKRLEQVQPMIETLERMQRDFRAGRRTPAGLRPRIGQSWPDLIYGMEERTEKLEEQVFAHPARRDPIAARVPVQQRLDALEDRQEELLEELESINKELRRLKREQRNGL